MKIFLAASANSNIMDNLALSLSKILNKLYQILQKNDRPNSNVTVNTEEQRGLMSMPTETILNKVIQ